MFKKYAGLIIVGIIVLSVDVYKRVEYNSENSRNTIQNGAIMNVEIVDGRDDTEVIKANVEELIKSLGGDYDYTIDGHKVTISVPTEVAFEYRDKVEANIRSTIENAVDEGIVKNIVFSDDYSELTIRASNKDVEEGDYDTMSALGFKLGGYSSLYQAFNGVPIENQKLVFKAYVGRELVVEESVNFGTLNWTKTEKWWII